MSSATGNLAGDVTDILHMVLAPLVTLESYATSVAERLGVVSTTLMDIFLVIAVVVMGIRFAVSNSMVAQDMFFELFKFIIFWSAIYWMVGEYDELIGRFYDGFQVLGQSIETAGAQEIEARALQAEIQRAEGTDRALPGTHGYEGEMDNDVPGIGGVQGLGSLLLTINHFWENADAQTKENVEGMAWGLLTTSFDRYYTMAYIASVMLIAQAIVVVYVLMYSLVMVVLWFLKALVIGIGPLMLAMFVVPYLNYLADGWVRLAIITGLIYTMLSLAMTVYSGLMLGVIAESSLVSDIDWDSLDNSEIRELVNIAEFVPFAVIAITGALLMTKIPAFVEMLVMGRMLGATIAGAAGAGAGMAAKAGAKGGGKAGNAAAGATKGGGKLAWGGAKQIKRGASAAAKYARGRGG
ncbi:hypothetical protein [Thioalkalivibrio sp. ALE19]|uniref:hypothetical protein n=1 Tax=Thioalkalivibrio sp. ALE19 TaxID=1266909 RepID=UPI00048D32E9|nr:hypothetical protein [Thioalkalivibrio sp. ALE19]